MTADQRKREQFIAGLRAVASFYEAHPDAYYDGMHLTLNMYIWGRAARKTMVDTAHAFGTCNRIYDDRTVTVTRHFSEQVALSVFAPRSKVCRSVVLGERILPARIIPAVETRIIPAVTEQIVAWHCDLLL